MLKTSAFLYWKCFIIYIEMDSQEEKKSSNFFRENKKPLIFSFSLFLISLSFLLIEDYWFRGIREEIFNSSQEAVVNQIEGKIEEFNYQLKSIVAFFVSSNEVDRQEFSNFIDSQGSLQEYDSLLAMQFIRVLKDEEIDSFLESRKEDGFDDFIIKPEGKRDIYYVVDYIEPILGNEGAFGFDNAADPTRKTTIEKSIDENDYSLTGPINLIQSGRESMIMFLPIFKNNLPINTVNQRRENIYGFAVTLIDTKKMFNDLSEDIFSDLGIFFDITDVTDSNQSKTIYESGKVKEELEFYSKRDFNIGGRTWRMEIFSAKEFFSRFNQQKIIKIFSVIAGMLVSLVVFAFLYFSNKENITSKRQSQLLEKEVKKAVSEVEKQKEDLKKALILSEKQKKEIEEKAEELKKINDLTINRELKMVQLKKELDNLRNKNNI